ncbi:complex I assembly factor TIMMDC1, mitochondrial [Antennarius striatus]|uniref:complex I assembly factor TIMMDC1, mitochondrial n=1 Tax=Antennarius striatus TaxID=241820 RepID=UPI0035AE4831
MHPELPRTGPALQRHRSDSAPGVTLSTGRLQGFIQSARPPSFCFLLPRVHAADTTAAQPAQTPASSSLLPSSTSPAPAPTPSPSFIPECIGNPELPETGWERIKHFFHRDGTPQYPEEINNVIKSGLFSGMIGFLYGGVPAARYARRRYIQSSQAEIYTSRVDAIRSSHNAAIRGLLRYGCRWGWRVAAFVTLFNSVSTGLLVYRNKYAISNYAAAGAVSGALFRVSLGPKGVVAGAVIGTVLGIPIGALIIGMQSLMGQDPGEGRKRKQKELYEKRLGEWTGRLQLTDELIGDLTVRSEHDDTSQDVDRIQELLSLPPNDDAVDSSSQ